MAMSRVSVHDGLGNMLFNPLLQTLGSTTYVMALAVAQNWYVMLVWREAGSSYFIIIAETRLKAILGDISKELLKKKTLQQLKRNSRCNNKYIFKHFTPSKHASSFLSESF